MSYRSRILKAVVIAAALGLSGCAQMRDMWHAIAQPFSKPSPSQSPSQSSMASSSTTPGWSAGSMPMHGPQGIVIAQFAEWDGAAPVPMPISPALTEAVISHVASTDQFTVVNDDRLAQRVREVLQWHRSDLERKLVPIASLNDRVRYVVLGRIAQFAHVTHSPQDLRGWTPAQHQREAVVALHLRVVDLHERQLVMDEVVTGSAWASEKPLGEMYRGVSVQSARFGDTPLGMASHDATQRAATRLASLAPTTTPQRMLRIVNRLDGRRVQLSNESSQRINPGEMFFIATFDETGTHLRTIIDPVMQLPLRARMEQRTVRPTAWLMGEPPADVDLRGAVLLTYDPSQRIAGAGSR